MPAFDLDAALRETVARGASDLHLKYGARPHVRVDGELADLRDFQPLDTDDVHALQERVLVTGTRRRQLDERGSADASYANHLGRFRVAAFVQRGLPSFVFRVIPAAPDPATLGLPDVLSEWADAKRGLVVVTGQTGAGKSTTCAALLQMVNDRRACHIVTIEDPIEYVHTDRQALVSQREVGTDTPSYHEALRAALRQDPDVILVGEVRDEDTAMTALRAAETGHLVLCTMHTLNAAETVQRFVALFGERHAALARQMLAGTLVGVCSQRLIPRARGGRLLNAEILVSSARVRDIIAGSGDQTELMRAMAAGDFYGMCTFDQDLLRHVSAGAVDRDVAMAYATNAHDFRLLLDASEQGLALDGHL